MTTSQLVPLIVLAAVGPLVGLPVAVLVARPLVTVGLASMFTAFPPVLPAPGAIRREFQSFSINIFSFGGCIHATADDRFLHLDPARLVRWFGMRPMSIPWEAITVASAKPRSLFPSATVHSGPKRWKLSGPRWCMSLINPP